MENTGAIFARESGILADPDTLSTTTRKSIASLVAHEVAHQWFGDSVSLQRWSDVWLKEGFATFVGYQAMAALEPAQQSWLRFGQRVKPRAYEKAAQAVSGYAADVSGLDLKGILAIPSVGKSIGEKVHEYLTTGAIAELDELRAKGPAGVRDMMRIPGLGPKKAMSLYTEVGL